MAGMESRDGEEEEDDEDNGLGDVKSRPDRIHDLPKEFGEAALDGEFLSSYDIEGKNYWSSMGTPACLTMSVTTIKIIGFKGEQLEIEFLQFLLENARVLQKIIIRRWKSHRNAKPFARPADSGRFFSLLELKKMSGQTNKMVYCSGRKVI